MTKTHLDQYPPDQGFFFIATIHLCFLCFYSKNYSAVLFFLRVSTATKFFFFDRIQLFIITVSRPRPERGFIGTHGKEPTGYKMYFFFEKSDKREKKKHVRIYSRNHIFRGLYFIRRDRRPGCIIIICSVFWYFIRARQNKHAQYRKIFSVTPDRNHNTG